MAPKKNKNARKPHPGIQVNFYLSGEDTSAIRRVLKEKNGVEQVTDQDVRQFARTQSKNAIWQAIKSELPPIII